jgi:hypothetical protein
MNNDDMNENDGPAHIEITPPDDSSAGRGGQMAAAPAAAPAAPRSFPQHYKLLFGAFCVLIGSMAVWQRAHVFGVDVEGEEMISGNLLTILSGYCVLIGMLNIMHGRLAGMLAAFLTALAALYFGLPGMYRTYTHDAFVTEGEIAEYISSVKSGEGERIPKRFEDLGMSFPSETITNFKTKQDKWYYVMGQFAPGPIFTSIGGFLLLWVFAGAIFGGKKKSSSGAPPPAARRRRR